MTINVLFFAHLQDIAGSRQQNISIHDSATVRDVAALLERQYPQFARLLDYGRVAVNAEFAEADTPLREGDEVAFLPPVSGG